MKNSKHCPKCSARDVLKIRVGRGQPGVTMIYTSFLGVVCMTRYVCCNCGFSEEWVESAEDLQKLEKKFGNE